MCWSLISHQNLVTLNPNTKKLALIPHHFNSINLDTGVEKDAAFCFNCCKYTSNIMAYLESSNMLFLKKDLETEKRR